MLIHVRIINPVHRTTDLWPSSVHPWRRLIISSEIMNRQAVLSTWLYLSRVECQKACCMSVIFFVPVRSRPSNRRFAQHRWARGDEPGRKNGVAEHVVWKSKWEGPAACHRWRGDNTSSFYMQGEKNKCLQSIQCDNLQICYQRVQAAEMNTVIHAWCLHLLHLLHHDSGTCCPRETCAASNATLCLDFSQTINVILLIMLQWYNSPSFSCRRYYILQCNHWFQRISVLL